MSVGAKHWALAQKVEGGSSPRVVLFYLADWIIGANQTECWPSLDTLAFETGMNRQTIMKATASLEKQGLITKRVEWLRSDKSLKKRVAYRLNGYEPSVWAKSKRPEAPDSVKSRTSEKLYVQDFERTENNTFEGTKSHTFDGTKNRTFDGVFSFCNASVQNGGGKDLLSGRKRLLPRTRGIRIRVLQISARNRAR